MRRWLSVFCASFGLVFVLAACGFLENQGEAPETVDTVVIPSPANTPDIAATTSQTGTLANSPVLTFTIWTMPEISTDPAMPGGSVLAGQLEAFQQTHPDINLQVQHKSVLGQGSILNYLRNGREVAPTILPDVVLIPSWQLASLADDELIFPVGALEESMITDLFPAARAMATVDEELLAYPYILNNLEHLAYDGTVITTTIPATWDELVNVPQGKFLFPGAGPDGAELLLQFYLAQGGTLTDEEGNIRLETEPLATALSQFFGAAANNFILPESNNLNNLNDVWRLYQSNTASIALTDGNVMLPPRAQGATSRFATIPGLTMPFSPLVGSWVWAVSTPDPAQQAIAAELISWLGSASNMGEWSLQSGQIPSRRTAFDEWPAGDDYYRFLRAQAEVAQPLPAEANSSLINALTSALVSVLNGSETPADAAQNAADIFNP